ncbi:MAG: hypothetical protein JNM66_00050 [Bryobacterales bacterium]|nr:hypothetical protein [Bryobacterales bacterium]
MDIEDILDSASGQISLWLGGHTLNAARLVSWNRDTGLLVCRGGSGFTDEDVHYIRAAHIQGVTLRVAAPRTESDRLGPEIREALRQAAGYPLSVAIRPDAFASEPAALAAWLQHIVEAVALLEPQREAMQAQIDQILLREGTAVAVLGGSSLILEATPEAIPAAETIRAAIAPLL